MTISRPKLSAVDTSASRVLIYNEVAQTLRACGIAPLILRDDPERLGELVELDILVRSRHLKSAAHALDRAGWEVQDSGLFHPCKRALVKLVDGELLKIDLHGAVIDGGHIYLAADKMFENARELDSGFLVPSMNAWVAHVALHIILAKQVVPAKYRERLSAIKGDVAAIASATGLVPSRTLQRAVGSLLSAAQDEMDSGNVAALPDLRRRVRRRLFLAPANFLRTLWLVILWPIGQAMGWRPGVLIVFIGPDGAGKSTAIECVSQALAKLQMPVRRTYLGPWERPVLPTTKLLNRYAVGHSDEVLDLDPGLPLQTRISKHVKANVKRAIYYVNLCLELWARHARNVFPHLALRRVVLGDRYVFDLAIGHYNKPVRTWLGVRRLVMRLIVRPHITVMLDNDAEVIWGRKKEYPLAAIEAALARYRLMAPKIGAEILRTDVPEQVMVAKFIEDHWRTFVRLRRDRIRFWSL
jgi:thymidylate kinase